MEFLRQLRLSSAYKKTSCIVMSAFLRSLMANSPENGKAAMIGESEIVVVPVSRRVICVGMSMSPSQIQPCSRL